MALKAGTRMMWSQTLPGIYESGAVLKRGAVESLDPRAVPCTVVKVENDQGTLIRVKLDKGKKHAASEVEADKHGTVVLTSDELIAVTE